VHEATHSRGVPGRHTLVVIVLNMMAILAALMCIIGGGNGRACLCRGCPISMSGGMSTGISSAHAEGDLALPITLPHLARVMELGSLASREGWAVALEAGRWAVGGNPDLRPKAP
jgi:hypothetical protein